MAGFPLLRTPVSAARVRLARSLALLVDFSQVIAFPLFFAGAASPLADVLDLATAAVMTALVGWHWAFLPSFAAEVIPVLDLFPNWTAAVFFATRGQAHEPAPTESGPKTIDITAKATVVPAPKR